MKQRIRELLLAVILFIFLGIDIDVAAKTSASLLPPTTHATDLPPGDYWRVLRVATADASSVRSGEALSKIAPATL